MFMTMCGLLIPHPKPLSRGERGFTASLIQAIATLPLSQGERGLGGEGSNANPIPSKEQLR